MTMEDVTMLRIDQLDLPHLAWETPEFAADPYPHIEAARRQHPWLATTTSGYVVFELQAIRDLLIQDDKLRTAFDGIVDLMQAHGTPWGRFAAEQMIALPDREHKLLRDTFAAKFTPRYAAQLRPTMREVMTELLREWAPRKDIDFEEFASYYPVSVTARMIGAPLAAIPQLRSSLEAMGLSMSLDSAIVPKLDAAMAVLDDFVNEMLAERRAHTREGAEPDLLDMLIEAGEADNISDRTLADLLIFLFVAGYDTSKNVLTYMMHLMVQHPGIYERCAVDLDYCRKVVEESLRLFNPSSTFRATRQDIVYRDVLIPRDTMLFFTLNVAGRDTTAFADPHAFEPERAIAAGQRHVGFGLGKHMCLGQFIARAQLQEGIHLIAQHMLRPCASGAPGWRPFPGVWGIKGLPIAFTPAVEREIQR
jgi:cytochrome P450